MRPLEEKLEVCSGQPGMDIHQRQVHFKLMSWANNIGLPPSGTCLFVNILHYYEQTLIPEGLYSASTHKRDAFTQIEVPYPYAREGEPKTIPQMLWPDHCVTYNHYSDNSGSLIAS